MQVPQPQWLLCGVWGLDKCRSNLMLLAVFQLTYNVLTEKCTCLSLQFNDFDSCIYHLIHTLPKYRLFFYYYLEKCLLCFSVSPFKASEEATSFLIPSTIKRFCLFLDQLWQVSRSFRLPHTSSPISKSSHKWNHTVCSFVSGFLYSAEAFWVFSMVLYVLLYYSFLFLSIYHKFFYFSY